MFQWYFVSKQFDLNWCDMAKDYWIFFKKIIFLLFFSSKCLFSAADSSPLKGEDSIGGPRYNPPPALPAVLPPQPQQPFVPRGMPPSGSGQQLPPLPSGPPPGPPPPMAPQPTSWGGGNYGNYSGYQYHWNKKVAFQENKSSYTKIFASVLYLFLNIVLLFGKIIQLIV